MKRPLFIYYLDRFFTIIIISLGFILIGINVLQILIRGFLRESFLWVLEFSEFLGSWIIFLGASIMFLRNTEVKVTAIVNLFPIKAQKVIEILISILGIVFAIYLIFGNNIFKKYVSMIQPDFFPVSFKVHTFPIYILGFCIIYNCLYIIFNKDRENNNIKENLEEN